MATRLPVTAVVVFGSVARGDFNAWSDIDVLVVTDGLPDNVQARLALLHDRRYVGVQPVGWTAKEFAARRSQHDPIAVEAIKHGIAVRGALPSAGIE